MPKSTTVLIIRHCEKPLTGTGLTVAGEERSRAYAIYFQNYLLDGKPIKLDFLFAAADTPESHRSRLTLEPLAHELKLKIDNEHRDHQEIVEDILEDAEVNRANVLIGWHHGDILALTVDLGVDATALPPESKWPTVWPGEVFGWLMQIRYDEHGLVIPAETFCINQKLMYDDFGKDPPAFA
jgi:hypothetical protein